MTERPTMQEVMMRSATVLAARSTCLRRVKVGTVITDWEVTNVVGIGYNGPARGLPHDCTPSSSPTMVHGDVLAFDQRGVTLNDVPLPQAGACTCVHAETNALLKAPYDRGPLILFTTLSPCPTCARLILNSAVRHVVYLEEYRLPLGLHILTAGGVTHQKLLMTPGA